MCSLPPKSISVNASVWRKTTLITGIVEGVNVILLAKRGCFCNVPDINRANIYTISKKIELREKPSNYLISVKHNFSQCINCICCNCFVKTKTRQYENLVKF